MEPAAVLAALAELAPARHERLYDVTGGRRPLWLRDPDRLPRTRTAERLAAIDALHQEERLLRRGWVFVIGSAEIEGARRAVCVPLVSEPVRMRRTLRGHVLSPAGDLEITPLIEDPDLAAELERDGGNTGDWLNHNEGLNDWIHATVRAAGLSIDRILRNQPPRNRMSDDGRDGYRMVAVKRAGVYVARDVFGGSLRETLRSWAARPGLERTALAAVYGISSDDDQSDESPEIGITGTARITGDGAASPTDGAAGGIVGSHSDVQSPLPLDEAQAEVVRRARTDRVTVVSGPPGSGKSHTVVAAALDVVDRGGSVLLATQSAHAADVLGQMLDRYPGPTPVLFGDAERRERIAAELAGGISAGVGSDVLRRDLQVIAELEARVRQLSAAVESALMLELRAAELPRWEPLLPALAADVPGAFASGADLDRAKRLADLAARSSDPGCQPTPGGPAVGAAEARPEGWRARWRQRVYRWRGRRAMRVLRASLEASAAVSLDRIRAAISAAQVAQAAARLAVAGGTDLSATWHALQEAEKALSTAVGVAMRHRAGSAARWDRDARRSAAALAGALRAGRNRRRQLLAGMDGQALVRGMPLWVGTASDTGDLLPPVPGLFDLVILDEASHLDQMRMAPVLARARRALIVGDPRQLRFVSFVSDADVMATLHRYGLDERADVRRMSAFDLATGAAPVTWLEQHYRSVPHLIEFSARRFYAGRLWVATRHPSNDSLDVIDVVRVDAGGPVATGTAGDGAAGDGAAGDGAAGDGVTGDGAAGDRIGSEVSDGDASDRDGVNRAEVAAAVQVVRELAAGGTVGIGVITPFRAQADALESALIEAFPLDELERLALRVGTVHSFQGSEAHTVVVSLALTDCDPPARARFVADPQLFNVMITRARERMVVVASLTQPDGVVGDYLAFAGTGPSVLTHSRHSSEPSYQDASHQDASHQDASYQDAWTDALATELRRAGMTVHRTYRVGRWTVDLVVGDRSAAVGLVCRVHPGGTAAHLARQRSLARAGWRLVDAFPSRWSGDPARAAVELTAGVLAR